LQRKQAYFVFGVAIPEFKKRKPQVEEKVKLLYFNHKQFSKKKMTAFVNNNKDGEAQ
jgi:hypothetical protein